MSLEQASNGPGDLPERSPIGYAPERNADGPQDTRDTDLHSDSAGDGTTDDDDAEHDEGTSDGVDAPDDAIYYEDQVEPEYGILGFTLRELVIVGAWALAFIVSFFPVLNVGASVWTSGIDWILTIGVPTAAAFLVVLRRLSPEGIRRVGSLGIDQFASVAAVVAGAAWAQILWRQVAASIDTGGFLVGWVPIAALIATLVLIAATVAAPLIPRLRDDFEGRMETLAHRSADPVRPVIRRPRPERVVGETDPTDTTDAAGPGADEADPAAGVDAADDAPVTVGTVSDPHSHESTDEDETSDTDADATRVIEVGPPIDARDAATASAAAASTTGPMPEADLRQTGTAYTDPIGALHEIFESKGTVVPGEADAAAGLEDPAVRGDHDETGSPADGETSRDGTEAEALLRRDRNEHARLTGSEAQPFWILAGTERDVLDERGHPLYRIGPSAWTLVIEDRGGAYVVRHDDGRIGYLHDLTDITKG